MVALTDADKREIGQVKVSFSIEHYVGRLDIGSTLSLAFMAVKSVKTQRPSFAIIMSGRSCRKKKKDCLFTERISVQQHYPHEEKRSK